MKRFWDESTDFQSVLKKHGWSSDFPEKFVAIQLAHGFMAQKKEVMASIPAEQQAMVKEIVSEQRTALEKEVHPKDIEMVGNYTDELTNALDF
jgi:hypothetical protein